MTSIRTVSPFSRLRGDISLRLEIEGGKVKKASSSCTFPRGIEYILKGRDPMDAIVITCRVCGHCGAAHSAASSAVIANAYGTGAPPNGVLCRNIIQGIETILSHITHFYLAFMGDFVGPPHDAALTDRFMPVRGKSFRRAVQVRARFLAMLGIVAGKWPNTLALQPGGTTKTLNSGEISRAWGVLVSFRRFLEEDMFGCSLDEWLGLSSVEELDAWLESAEHAESDAGVFIRVVSGAGLRNLGAGSARFVAGGGFPVPGSDMDWFKRGYYDGEFHELDLSRIKENIKYACYEAEMLDQALPESECAIKPDKAGAYSWCKAVRYMGKPAEVGPLARMVINREPLALDLLKKYQGSMFARTLMRLWETAMITRQLREWLHAVKPKEAFYVREEPRDACAFAVVPAPRGMLGHWVIIENGKIRNYQIVTPTGWNFSPRDSDEQVGPVEEVLTGIPVAEGVEDKRISHIIKSFDPCLYCSVH